MVYKNLKYDIHRGVFKVRTKILTAVAVLSVGVLGIGSAAGLFPAIAGAAPNVAVYNNIPSPQPGNVPSVGYEATSTSEFGSQVQFDGTERQNPVVTVLMSSWACKSGTWNAKNCITNVGSTFNHPVTVNIYNVNPDNTPGTLIKTQTQTFAMPYRPTADDGTFCNAGNSSEGLWWDGAKCNNGKAFPISFNLTGTVLPDKAIVSVAYNTSHHGYAPIGDTACNATPQGCPYDSLNVGTSPIPSVGTSLPTSDDAYYNTSFAGFYCDLGVGGSGTFRLDAGCWTGYLPAIKVEASGFTKDDCKNNGWKRFGNFHSQNDCNDFCDHNSHNNGDRNRNKSGRKGDGWQTKKNKFRGFSGFNN